jgi:hypothetical protein
MLTRELLAVSKSMLVMVIVGASDTVTKELGAGKPREPARWKRALRSAGILPAGSGGIPAASFGGSVPFIVFVMAWS